MKLSILIATIGRRRDKFASLLRTLNPQVQAHHGEVEITAYWNNGEIPVGEIRRALIEQAKGEYVCFIDDDDSVPESYCDQIVKAIQSKPDYIGFRVQFFNEGVEAKPVFHSIKYSHWHEDERGYYRGVTHLNPVKRSIALQGDFGNSRNAGEDARWAHSVTPLVKTEEYIDKVMYFYYHDRSDTTFGGDKKLEGDYERPKVEQPHFSYHPNSKETS